MHMSEEMKEMVVMMEQMRDQMAKQQKLLESQHREILALQADRSLAKSVASSTVTTHSTKELTRQEKKRERDAFEALKLVKDEVPKLVSAIPGNHVLWFAKIIMVFERSPEVANFLKNIGMEEKTAIV